MIIAPFLSFFSTVRPREQYNGVCTYTDIHFFHGHRNNGTEHSPRGVKSLRGKGDHMVTWYFGAALVIGCDI